jgi:hypothetical protein
VLTNELFWIATKGNFNPKVVVIKLPTFEDTSDGNFSSGHEKISKISSKISAAVGYRTPWPTL